MYREIAIVVDIEPNGRAEPGSTLETKDAWAGTVRAAAELQRWRDRLQERTRAQVQFNWFLRCDPQVDQIAGGLGDLELDCPELATLVREAGDLCGIHTHFWRWDGANQRWFNEFRDEAWLAHCLQSSIGGFERQMGYRPVASRFGDRFCSHTLVSLLRAEGIRYDLTLEPGIPGQPVFDDPHATAWLPDYRRAPRQPYRPSETDYLTPSSDAAGGGLWMIPVTTTVPERWIPVRRFPYVMKASRTLNLVLRPRSLWRFLDSELRSESAGPDAAAPMVIVLRTGDLGSPSYLENFRFVADRLAEHPALSQVRFTRADEAAERYGRRTQCA